MSELELVTWDEEKLRQECEDVELPPSDETKLLIFKMIRIMVQNDGVGLAGPQVDLPKNLFVALLDNELHAFINPVIEKVSDSTATREEGCLSLPGVTCRVKRPKTVWVSYYDANGDYHESRKFKRLSARIIQHEYDHLDGKLILDYVRNKGIMENA